jgi:hypothetical protein
VRFLEKIQIFSENDLSENILRILSFSENILNSHLELTPKDVLRKFKIAE